MADYRTIFISDVHLGTRGCQAERLCEFLDETNADTIYLVGDIVDFWRIKRGAIWPQAHNDVLRKLLEKVHSGSRVIYIPGNHDEGLRDYCGSRFGGIEIVRDAVHETSSGLKYLVIHGDEFDVVVRYARWLAFLGDRGYQLALWFNWPLNAVRKRLGLGYWSLSSFLKNRVKQAVNFIGDFETSLADEGKRRGVDGVICGHIHHAAMHSFGDVQYVNTGDWVESCTAVVENDRGNLELVRWFEILSERAADAQEFGRSLEAAA